MWSECVWWHPEHWRRFGANPGRSGAGIPFGLGDPPHPTLNRVMTIGVGFGLSFRPGRSRTGTVRWPAWCGWSD